MARGMFSVVPALGTLFQGFVVSFLVLFNEALQADIAADLVSEVIALEQEQKTGDSTVSIPEGMDT